VTLPPRLPVTARPARHEALASYLRRLAVLNSLDGDELWNRATLPAAEPRPRRRLPDTAAVAALTGREPAELAAALPELRDPAPDWQSLRHAPQAGCPRCDAPHPGGQVYRLLPHHEYACTRHRHWIGPPDTSRPGPELPGLPEIITAQRRHLRLVRQHGWALAHDAILTAFMICGHLWRWPVPGTDAKHPLWERRGPALIPPGQADAQFSASRVFAAVYPEAVSLATVLAAPQWRALATGTRSDTRALATEIGRHVGIPAYQPHPHDASPPGNDLDERAWRLAGHSAQAFPGCGLPSRLGNVHALSLALRDRTAPRFEWGRPAGSIILGHRHIQPVRIRRRTVLMQYINRASWPQRNPKNAELTRTTTHQAFRINLSSRRSADRPTKPKTGTDKSNWFRTGAVPARRG
jgi:TniQ